MDFESTRPTVLQLTIYPEYQADVYGLGASLFNKKIECELGWNEKEILLTLKCKSYKRNRNDKEIVELEIFEYQKESKNLLTLKGQITEGFVPLRKIETQVPLSGVITVNETELDRPVPPGLIQVDLPKSVLVPVPKPTPAPPPPQKRGELKPESFEMMNGPQETLRNEVDAGLKEFSPPAEGGGVPPEVVHPVAPPGTPTDEIPQIPTVIRQSEPEMIESSDKPVGR